MSVCEHRHTVFVWLSFFFYFHLSFFPPESGQHRFRKTTRARILKFSMPVHLAMYLNVLLCIVKMFKIMQISSIFMDFRMVKWVNNGRRGLTLAAVSCYLHCTQLELCNNEITTRLKNISSKDMQFCHVYMSLLL